MVRASPTLPSVTRTGQTLLGPTLLGTSRPGSGLPLLSHPSLRRAGPGRRPWPSVGVIAESLRAVVDLALPLVCASCARPGVACCPDCLAACGWPGGDPLVRSPRPRPDGLPTTWAAGAYEGELRRLLVAYKDGDRRDLAEPLARLLRPVLRAAAQDVAQAVTDRGAGGTPSSSCRSPRRRPRGVAGVTRRWPTSWRRPWLPARVAGPRSSCACAAGSPIRRVWTRRPARGISRAPSPRPAPVRASCPGAPACSSTTC